LNRVSRILIAALAALAAARPSPAGEAGEAPPPTVRSNRFPGRAWIPEPVLEGHLRLPPGSPYDREAAKAALERLLAWKYIETAGPPEATFSEDGRSVDLAWPVNERPLVRGVSIEWRGDRRFETKEILEGLRTKRGEPLVRAYLEADREDIRTRHVKEGHPLCAVEVSERPVAEGAVELEIAIDPGPRAWIRRIEIEGCREVPARHILSAMESRRRTLFGFISRGTFDPARFERDVERARDHCRSRGFLEALVTAEPPLFSENFSKIDLGLRVEEGRRYRLSGIEIRGNGPGVPTELLLRQVRARPGGYWDGRSLDEDRARLYRWYEERYDRAPWIDLHAEYSLDPSETTAKAVFEIQEGFHLRVGRVDVRGNVRTRDRVIRSLLTVRPATPLTITELARSEGRLASSGFFEPEKVSVKPGTAGGCACTAPGVGPGDVRNVEARVEEKRTGMIQAGGGASSGEGEVAYVSLAQTNFDLFALPGKKRPLRDAFTGGGQLLQLEFAPGTKISQYSFRFEEPYLFDTSRTLSARGGSEIWDRDGYDEVRVGGELAVRQYLDEAHRLSARLGWTLEDVGISDISPDAPPDVTDVRGHTFLSYPSLRLTWSDLDLNPFRGPAGLLVEARGDLADGATGSDSSFGRTLLVADLYQPVSKWINRVLDREILSEEPRREHVLRIGGRLGWTEGLDGEDVPIFERFFLGGPRSFRGFDYRGVGPEAGGVRLGGRAYFQGVTEYSFPIVIPEIRGAALFEFADLESRFPDLGAGRIRTSAGAGLRFRVPFFGQVFPVDFYFVQTLAKERGDEERFFTFTLGFGF
jgi:outer membrane protein insertion porin family